MVQSNHSALGQGLRLYTDGMRRFIKQRLVSAFPNKWWDDGVMKSLPDWRKRQLQNDISKNLKSDRAEHLDPGLFAQVIPYNHTRFQDVFPNYKQTSSFLTQISEARNTWAHSLTSDLPDDEVVLSLMAMEKLLSDAGLPEAEDVEKLRKEVMRTPEAGPAGPVVEDASTPVARPSTGIPYWWEVCEPHDGFKNPTNIDESRFAASPWAGSSPTPLQTST